MLKYAVLCINMALVFYTIGVWAEKRQGLLKKWHLIVFYIGLLFDTIGTTAMGEVAGGGFKLNFHGITGLLAILLMMFHAIWASIVLKRNNEVMKVKFHKFSVLVWVIWLIPFLSGAIFGVTR